MTDVVTTQVSVEEWAQGTPVVQVTIVVVEEWATVATGPVIDPPSAQSVRVMVMA